MASIIPFPSGGIVSVPPTAASFPSFSLTSPANFVPISVPSGSANDFVFGGMTAPVSSPERELVTPGAGTYHIRCSISIDVSETGIYSLRWWIGGIHQLDGLQVLNCIAGSPINLTLNFITSEVASNTYTVSIVYPALTVPVTVTAVSYTLSALQLQ